MQRPRYVCDGFFDHDLEKIVENPNAHGAYQVKLLGIGQSISKKGKMDTTRRK